MFQTTNQPGNQRSWSFFLFTSHFFWPMCVTPYPCLQLSDQHILLPEQNTSCPDLTNFFQGALVRVNLVLPSAEGLESLSSVRACRDSQPGGKLAKGSGVVPLIYLYLVPKCQKGTTTTQNSIHHTSLLHNTGVSKIRSKYLHSQDWLHVDLYYTTIHLHI